MQIFCFSLILVSLIIAFSYNPLFYDQSGFNHLEDFDPFNDNSETNRHELSSTEPNGKPLLVQQYADISTSYSNVKSGENISFTMAEGWTAKNTTVNYEGVSIKKGVVLFL